MKFRRLRLIWLERFFALVFSLTILAGCTGVPEGATVVQNFQLDRYLGTWYEIARLDHRFERGLSQVQAQYSMRDDGGVLVVNKGFDAVSGEWNTAEGKAYFVAEPDVGQLKVSFFGPFYGAYNIIDLDMDGYRYSMVVGPSTKYLWILARDPVLEQVTLNRLVSKAKALGFSVENLIFPNQIDTEL